MTMENNNLPNEILAEIFKKLPYGELVKICGVSQYFLSLCDWSFWNEKAQMDFGVSSDYFNSLTKFENGLGSFEEISPDKYTHNDYGWKKNLKKKSGFERPNEGFYRYFQIVNRVSLRPEVLIDYSRQKQSNSLALFESRSFFSLAGLTNQYKLVDVFANKVPISELTELVNDVINLTSLMEGNFFLDVPKDRIAFFDTALEQIISPKLMKEYQEYIKKEAPKDWTDDEIRFYSHICQIQKGEISAKYYEVIADNYLFESEYAEFATIFQTLLKKGEYLPELVNKFVDLATPGCKEMVQEDGPYFLCFSLEGGNLQFIQEVLEMGDFFHPAVEQKFDRTRFMTSAYFSGKSEVIKIVSDADCHEISQDQKVEALVEGYHFHRTPERFLQRFVELGEISDESLIRVTSLADCDILAHFLELRIQNSDLPREKVVLQFLELIWYFLLGNLDLMAWAFRWFDTVSFCLTEEERDEFLNKMISSGPLSPLMSKLSRYHHYSPLSHLMISERIRVKNSN